MITCIYKIENKQNGHIYIGQALDFKARMRSHKFSALHEDDKDHNMAIHLAMAKYGVDAFSYDIIEQCLDTELNEKEQYWIAYYDSYHHGYNCTSGGQANSERLGRKVLAYDLDGQFVTSYPSAAKAARELNREYITIRQVLNGDRKSCANMQLKWEDDEPKVIEKYSSNQGGGIEVAQMDDNGKIIHIYKSAAEAARVNNYDASSIIKVCKKKLKHHKGYVWRYASEVC